MSEVRNGFYRDASAGTGKTYWIVKTKLAEIPKEEFNKVLIVTFTEKAAGELRNRIREEYGDDEIVEEMDIFTIHSFCQHVLEEYASHVGKPANLSLVDSPSDADSFIMKWVRDEFPNNEYFSKFSKESKDFQKDIRKLVRDLSKAIQVYSSGMEIESVKENDWYPFILSKLVEDLFCKWQEAKAQRKVQTYNDMITSVHDALAEPGSQLLHDLRDKYKVAIIDEFQDTNQIQWEIFKNIFGDGSHSLYVVGDPKQSIYAFQGSDVKVYKSAITESLQKINDKKALTNWRSSDDIIDGCNILFGTEGFFGDGDIHFTNSYKPDNNRAGRKSELCGEEVGPFWFPEKEVNEYEFAKFAVERILFCCAKKEDGTTNLRIPRKESKTDSWKLDNVSFKDFAILARTTSEMGPIEKELRKKGVVYVRYKDRNLFNGLECRSWISLLNAVDADDFSGQNRRLLSEALYTKFFNVPINEVDNEQFDHPTHSYRNLLFRWHVMAQEKRWTELIESIYEKSGLERTLTASDKIQSMVKFRQIGNYILEYLYDRCRSLADVCQQLSSLSTTNTEDEGALVERGSDRDCVRIMTIHAAKGLEFPIVIPVAGFKGRNNQIPQVYTYHDSKHFLGFTKHNNKKDGSSAQEKYWKEQMFEWRRLFYVAYTRATDLMILPRYANWNKSDDDNDYRFLSDAFKRYFEKDDLKPMYFKIEDAKPFNQLISSTEEENLEDQIIQMKKVFKSSKKLSVYKHSYTSLSHSVKATVSLTDVVSKEDESDDKGGTSLKEYDPAAVPVSFTSNEPNPVIDENYPKGSRLGSAVHEVFERAVFNDFRGNAGSDNHKDLIADCFAKQAIKMDEEGMIVRETEKIVRNTLNAELPVIEGSEVKDIEKLFKLCELPEENKRAEVEFFLSPEENTVFKHYCNGFVDLLFKRGEYYSILDWKTDTKLSDGNPLDYSSFEQLKERVDEAYSIQRVLYSYCLIKWLKQFDFYSKKTESEIFKNHFGGVYYVFVRGCVKDNRNGIYSQTWKSWDDLEASFNRIKKKRMYI